MRRTNGVLFPRRDILVLLAAIVASLFLMFSSDQPQLNTLRVWMLDGVGFLLDEASTFSKYFSLREENEWLRRRNAELMLTNSLLREAGFENMRLRQMLRFRSESKLSLSPARVIGHDEDGFVRSIIISAGKRDSLERNQAVVTAQGLVGKVYSVGASNASTQLLLDRNFRASAKIQRSRVMGIIKSIDGNRLALSEVSKRADVVVGDSVVTSGLSTSFPMGLPIGIVSEIVAEKHDMFLSIYVEPAVDFSRLEEVFVVRADTLAIR